MHDIGGWFAIWFSWLQSRPLFFWLFLWLLELSILVAICFSLNLRAYLCHGHVLLVGLLVMSPTKDYAKIFNFPGFKKRSWKHIPFYPEFHMHFICVLYAFFMHFKCVLYAFFMHFICTFRKDMHFWLKDMHFWLKDMHFWKVHKKCIRNAYKMHKKCI